MHILRLISLAEDYKGEHSAPDRNSGDPLHNVTKSVYPEDFYTLDVATVARYYGHGIPEDAESIQIIRQFHNKPEKSVKVYRAVPKFFSDHDKEIPKMEALINYFNTFNFFPVNDPIVNKYDEMFTQKHDMEYDDKIKAIYNKILEDIQKRKKEKPDIGINPNDWVAINKRYAMEHGKGTLRGNYKIVAKTIKAKQLFTSGDSFHEWGYDP